MNDIEKRARELLAAEYVKEGRMVSAEETMHGHGLQAHAEYIALRAIIAALTPPEGYVLVPVDKLFAVRQARLAMLQKASASAAGDESMWGEWATDLGFIIDLHSLPSRPEVK